MNPVFCLFDLFLGKKFNFCLRQVRFDNIFYHFRIKPFPFFKVKVSVGHLFSQSSITFKTKKKMKKFLMTLAAAFRMSAAAFAQGGFGGGQFDDLSFNVINHTIRFFTSFRMTEGFWDHSA